MVCTGRAVCGSSERENATTMPWGETGETACAVLL